jgi:hypothetical protein
MGEISDLIGIYGAIEAAVINNPARRAAVAEVLPIYGDDTLRAADLEWFEQFDTWATDKAGGTSPIPTVDEALKDLSKIPAEGRMRARRLLAIAALARADDDYADRRRTKGRLARDALRFTGIAADSDNATKLHDILTERSQDGLISADDWWETQVLPKASGLIAEQPNFIGHRPCTAGLVRVPLSIPGHGEVMATALKTEFESRGIDFDRVIRFLDPSNWKCCNGFWCQMQFVETMPSGARHFHEVVSLDCDHPGNTWTISAELDFFEQMLNGPRAAISEYHLSPPHPQGQDDVLVDAGVLMVEELEPPPVSRLRVTTTKRVSFTRNFPGPGMSIFMCALGYAAVAEDFVYTCAIDDAKAGSPFDPHPKRGTAGAHPPPLEPVIKHFADEIATAIKTCIRDLASSAEETSQKIEDKQYRADDLVQDAAGLWLKTFREGATAVDLGVRSAQAAAARRPRPGPPPPEASA